MRVLVLHVEEFLSGLNRVIDAIFRRGVFLFVKVQQRRERFRGKEAHLMEVTLGRSFLGEEFLTIPNLFSFSRVIFGLLLLPMILYQIPNWIIGVVFGAAIITDRLDGVWARLEGETRLGAAVDPLCDKIFFFCCALPYWKFFSPWIFWPLLGVEGLLFVIPLAALRRIRRGKLPAATDFRSNIFGKTKFVLEIIALACVILGYPAPANGLLLSAIVFALIGAHRKAQQVWQ